MGRKPKQTNQLIHETSPYLLQHAHNPVDWYPWGAAALEKARREDKPIFLSIGYTACHWCHVMEKERENRERRRENREKRKENREKGMEIKERVVRKCEA